MKKILLVALALCLSYGFAYSCLFNHSINLTTKMQNFETDSFTTKNGKSLKITFFKHASLLIEYAGKKFFIDPVSDYADFTQQPKADYILITHEHHDHFDTKAIAAIETPDTKIIANPNCQKMLDKGQAMKNGDILQITPEIKLEAVPAYNTTPSRDKLSPRDVTTDISSLWATPGLHCRRHGKYPGNETNKEYRYSLFYLSTNRIR